jgi:ferric-dicitrate binding protein FerR (iron transport regulator)
MTRHDESLLWEYAARELEPEEARLVQHHLSECPDCQEKLSDVRTAQGALNAARSAPLSLSFGGVDAALSKVIDRKLQAQAMGRRWVLGLSGGLVAVGVALVVFGLWPKVFSPPPAPAPIVVAPALEPVRVVPTVEDADGLLRVGVSSQVVHGGDGLESGDVLKTGARGKATLKLPEGTRLAMKGDTQLSLTRVQKEQIALTLERGHMAVAASHARERQGFVVHANGLMVTVVGTVFSVTSSRDAVDVAVSEGRVSVEAPEGLPQFVNAGQHVQFETRHWRSSRTALSPAEKKELQGLTQAAVPPQPVAATVHAAAVPANGGAARTPTMDELVPLPVPEKKTSSAAIAAAPEPAFEEPGLAPAPKPVDDENLLERLKRKVQAAREREPVVARDPVALAPVVPAEPVVAAPPPPPMAPAPAGRPAPDMTGLEVPLLVSPVESVRPAEQSEWAQLPAAKTAAAAERVLMPPPPAPTTQPVQMAQAEPPKRRSPTYAPSFEPEKPASKLSRVDEGAVPRDQEDIFMQRAGRALNAGSCERYLLGLEEVANDARSVHAEDARVYRGRCYDAMLKPKQASQEYRRYLLQYPRGRYVDEARQVMGESD